jgi:hypothetical protein
MVSVERFEDGWPVGKLIPSLYEWRQSAHKRLVLIYEASIEILETYQG